MAEVLIVNALPTAPEIAIEPEAIDISMSATCNVLTPSTDADDDDLVTTITWWLGDEAVLEGEESTLDLAQLALADGSLPAAGDSLRCSVTVTDGLATTEPVESVAVTLGDFDTCASEDNPCAEDAVCTGNGTLVPDCACIETSEGDGVTCTDIDDCADAPCQNSGTCIDAVGAFSCECADGYDGDTCDNDIDDCADAPCQNGGT